jgi:septum formation protein
VTAPDPRRLILASTSRYRREMLDRLGLPFECVPPGVDETAVAGEAPTEIALRLARAKAEAVATRHPGAIVIGSDQVAEIDGRALGKPGDRASALAQLRASSERDLVFHTAVCVWDGADNSHHAFLDETRVRMRSLTDEEIERYLDAEQPWDCAGSFKSEGLGVVLFESVQSDDPTALIGLPLIALARALRACGYSLP